MTNRVARLRPRLCAGLLLGAGLLTGDALAAPVAADYERLNQALIAEHIIPRYVALADRSDELHTAATAFCDENPNVDLAAVRTHFEAASDAWQAIQHVRFGPTELFMRGTRLAFWPDPRGATESQLAELLASNDKARLAPERFPDNGVAVQGFPALERILFDDAAPELPGTTPAAQFRCRVLAAMSANLHVMTEGLVKDWRDFADQTAAGETAFYQSADELTVDLFKSLYNAVELAADHKLVRPGGADASAARPRTAEAWRSGRSLDNVRINLAAGAAMYAAAAVNDEERRLEQARQVEVGLRFADLIEEAQLRELLIRAFRQTQATAAGIDVPLEQAMSDPAERKQFDKLVREILALKALLAQRLPPALGIPLGFNALDGD